MIEVEYSLTTSHSFLENIAAKLSSSSGQKVSVDDNRLIFPPEVAKGWFGYYSMDADLSMVVMDCEFYEAIKFKRPPLDINYFHALSFNLSKTPIAVEHHNSDKKYTGADWKNKILYSTSEKGLAWTAHKNSHIKMVVLYFTRAWLLRHYQIDTIPKRMPYAEEFMNDRALQFNLDLNLRMLLVLQDIISLPAPKYMPALYYEGSAKKLIAFVVARLIEGQTQNTKLNYNEVWDILHIKQKLEGALDQPFPALEDLAMACNVSKSKFEKLFKSVFGKNITEFFHVLRMKKAAQLLIEGYSHNKVSEMVGYRNRANFEKVFKNYYKTRPKAFQISLGITKEGAAS